MSESVQAEQPVSMIEGDRLCVGCAYNLRGQPVVREPHYGLIIARCPECGVPAAIQEYPLLGRWPGRIRVFVALSYALACLFVLFVTFMIQMGLTELLSSSINDTTAYEIAERWALYVNAEEAKGNTPLSGAPLFTNPQRDNSNNLVPYVWNYVDLKWLDTQDLDAGFGDHISSRFRNMLPALFIASLASFVGGCVWAVLLLAGRRRVIFLIALIPPALVVSLIMLFGNSDNGFNGWDTAYSIAEDRLRLASGSIIAAVWIVFGGLGILFGRPLARLGVRALMPPTMRGALAELWFTDNKPLPTNTRAPRTLHPEVRQAQES